MTRTSIVPLLVRLDMFLFTQIHQLRIKQGKKPTWHPDDVSVDIVDGGVVLQ